MGTAVVDAQELSFRFHQVAKWRGFFARDAHLLARELYIRAFRGEPLLPDLEDIVDAIAEEAAVLPTHNANTYGGGEGRRRH